MMRRIEEVDALHEPDPPHPDAAALRALAVVSGESDDGETDEFYKFDPSNPSNVDGFYDSNLDAEDEAYVYRNMRSGIKQNMTVIQNKTGEKVAKNVSVYKPRDSDAQLQCPLCFQLVCMDCQRHERYFNQFRAMFVMGITVDWHSKLVYDESQQALVSKSSDDDDSSTLPLSCPEELTKHVDGEYFSVLCSNCGTQVAALDIKEEVYFFHGCLESS
jgi:hypothetical protein